MKFYSDLDFFFERWLLLQEEQQRQNREKRRRKKKSRARQGTTTRRVCLLRVEWSSLCCVYLHPLPYHFLTLPYNVVLRRERRGVRVLIFAFSMRYINFSF